MKLQFAFGNPRRSTSKGGQRKAKKAQKSKKVVASGRRKAKNGNSKKKYLHPVTGKEISARKLRDLKYAFGDKGENWKPSRGNPVAKKRRRLKRRKNPMIYRATKDGKLVHKSQAFPTAKEAKASKKKFLAARKKFRSIKTEYGHTSPAKEKAREALHKAQEALKGRGARLAALKGMKQLKKEGAEVRAYATKGSIQEDNKVASKKTAAQKKAAAKRARKAAAKKAKSAKKAGGHKKTGSRKKAGSRKKTGSRRKSTSRKKTGRRKSGSRRRKHAKMITHRHSANVRHLRKGTSIRVSGAVGKGRKKVRLSGRLKVNPRHKKHHSIFGRNPMEKFEKVSKTYLGLAGHELAGLAVGGALVPFANSIAKNYLGFIVQPLQQYAGLSPKVMGSVIPLLFGAGINAAAEHLAPPGKFKNTAKVVGEGLAAAGIVSFIASLSNDWLATPLGMGMSGVIYTPGYSGINYTPNMQGINYTPNMQGMGIMPQLGAGYTEAHKYSRADYGRQADFGRGADYGGMGEMPMDADVDEQYTPDDICEGSMSGSIG